jgi:predicted nucleotide-binding protein
MRECQAAIIHVGSEGVLRDEEGNLQPKINLNVVMEIGIARAIYDYNFILLVEDGLALPSNLQGLYECRYTGDALTMEATMKILEAFNAFKSGKRAA